MNVSNRMRCSSPTSIKLNKDTHNKLRTINNWPKHWKMREL